MAKAFQWSFTKFIASSFAFAIVLASGAIFSFDALQGQAVPVNTDNPGGSVDFVVSTGGECRIAGWAYDRNAGNGGKNPIQVAIYYKEAASGLWKDVGNTTANLSRTDLTATLGAGNTNHGFSFTFPSDHWNSGREYFVYALNVGAGGHKLLGSKVKPACAGNQTLSITIPTANQQLQPPNPFEIRWTSASLPATESVILSFTSAAGVITPIATVPNSGSYQWMVPNTLASQQGTIRIVLNANNAIYATVPVQIIAPAPVTTSSVASSAISSAPAAVDCNTLSIAQVRTWISQNKLLFAEAPGKQGFKMWNTSPCHIVVTTAVLSPSITNPAIMTPVTSKFETVAPGAAGQVLSLPANTICGVFHNHLVFGHHLYATQPGTDYFASTNFATNGLSAYTYGTACPAMPQDSYSMSYSDCFTTERIASMNSLRNKTGQSPYDYNDSLTITEEDIAIAKTLLCPGVTWHSSTTPKPINCYTPTDVAVFQRSMGQTKKGWLNTNAGKDGVYDGTDLAKIGNLSCALNAVSPV